jgi:uncharacterized protein (TIGR03437 family)
MNRTNKVVNMAVLAAVVAASLSAQTFTTLASFNGNNGAIPMNESGSAIVQGPDGNFYGSTAYGGPDDAGVIFKMTPAGTLSSLYNFTFGANGTGPLTGVIVGADGNLYGANGSGIFKLTLGGTFTVLSNSLPALNGSNGLVQASDGDFYGTTFTNDDPTLYGVVFRVTPAGALTVLYTFAPPNGAYPEAPLIQGTDGNLYGTTSAGGPGNAPVAFKITTGGGFTVVADLTFGYLPQTALLQATDGNFYGVAPGKNLVFKMTPQGKVTTLYTFCSVFVGNLCQDGTNPQGALIQGKDGNLYGTTGGGGPYFSNGGTIFQLTLAGKLTTLYSFCPQFPCTDGMNPQGALYQTSTGTLYGTTMSGGTSNQGVVFSLQLPGSGGSGSAPTILSGGIVNAASYAQTNGAGNPVAPGALVSIYTSQLSAQAASFSTSTLPASLGGVSVTFNGMTAPMVAVSPSGQYPFISAQVPLEITPGTASVVINVNGTPSASVQESIVASQPGIFTIPPTGQGNAILVFTNPSTNQLAIAAPPNSGIAGATAPIPRGTDGFFYITGLGAMTPSVPDGSGTCPAASGLCYANATPKVLVGGISAQVLFAGQAPGFPGVSQVNITVPLTAPTGNNVSLVVVSADGSVTSNVGTIAVQ